MPISTFSRMGALRRMQAAGPVYLLDYNEATFARAAQATSYDALTDTFFYTGPGAWLLNDQPRILSDGSILVEGARTNLFPQNRNVGGPGWGSAGSPVPPETGFLGPDGFPEAARLQLTSTQAWFRGTSAFPTAGDPFTASLFTRQFSGVGPTVTRLIGLGFDNFALVDPDADDAWTRYVGSVVPFDTAGCTFIVQDGRDTTADGGLPAGPRDVVYDLGQWEAGRFPSSPIRTAAVAFTRAHEVASYSDAPLHMRENEWRIKVWPGWGSDEVPEGLANVAAFGGTGVNSNFDFLQAGGGAASIRCSNVGTIHVSGTVTFSAGQELTLTVDPSAGTLVIEGATTGDGTYTGSTWTWGTGTFWIGNRRSTLANRPFFGAIGRPEADFGSGFVPVLNYRDATFTRASEAAAWDPRLNSGAGAFYGQGFGAILAANVPRIHPVEGRILVEGARTNRVLRNLDYAGASWHADTVADVERYQDGPDGLPFAVEVVVPANSRYRFNGITALGLDANSNALSLFSKQIDTPTTGNEQHSFYRGGVAGFAIIAADAAGPEPAWTRHSTQSFSDSGGGWFQLCDGYDRTSSGGIAAGKREALISHAQAEVGYYPSSPIYSGVVAGTRAGEDPKYLQSEIPADMKLDGAVWEIDVWPNFSSDDLIAMGGSARHYVMGWNDTVAAGSAAGLVFGVSGGNAYVRHLRNNGGVGAGIGAATFSRHQKITIRCTVIDRGVAGEGNTGNVRIDVSGLTTGNGGSEGGASAYWMGTTDVKIGSNTALTEPFNGWISRPRKVT